MKTVKLRQVVRNPYKTIHACLLGFFFLEFLFDIYNNYDNFHILLDSDLHLHRPLECYSFFEYAF